MEQQEQLWVLGDLYKFHLSTAEIAIIEIESAFQHGPPPHSHQQEVETLYVLEGQLEIVRAGETLIARKGDFVHFPKGLLHNFKTISPEGARILVTIQPGELAQLFREIGTRDKDRATDEDVMTQAQQQLLGLSSQYGLQIVPPS